MENLMQLTQLNSLKDVKLVLEELKKHSSYEINKKLLYTLLNGFHVIVQFYEANNPEKYKEDDAEVVLDLMRLYLKIQSLEVSSVVPSTIFSKSVPIAVTYIIGCLLHVTNVTADFYTEFIQLTIQLISRTDKNSLKKLEICGKGVIASLWKVIDKVDCFNNQMMVLNLFHQIMSHLDCTSVIFEVEKISNLNASEKDKLLEFLKVNNRSILYQKLSRAILNQYNMRQQSKNLIHSFSCESFKIGDQFSFSKLNHFDHLWIDINCKPKTLTFQGLFKPKSGLLPEKVYVSLRIKNFYCDKEKLKIEYKNAYISGSPVYAKESKNMSEAVLAENEMKRFLKLFKVNILEVQPNAMENNSAPIKNSVEPLPSKTEQVVKTFKKLSVEFFVSVLGTLKPKSLTSGMASNKQRLQERDSPSQGLTSRPEDLSLSVQTGKITPRRRFFKHPRQPKTIDIPWKNIS